MSTAAGKKSKWTTKLRAASEPSVDEQIERCEVSDTHVTFFLADSRVISVPLSWSWRLQDATPEQRVNFEIIGDGEAVHWPDVDEDLSARGALRGMPAPRPGSRTGESELVDVTSRNWSPGAIKQLREWLRDSQSRFGMRLGIRQATVSDWENGNQQPSPMAIQLLEMIAQNSGFRIGKQREQG